MEEKWYILAGTLIWTVVLIFITLILIRLLRQYRAEQREEQMEQEEAVRVANRFAAPDASNQSSSVSIESLDTTRIPIARRGTPFHHLVPRNRAADGTRPTRPVRAYVPRDWLLSAHGGLTPGELRTHCPVVTHEEVKEKTEEVGAKTIDKSAERKEKTIETEENTVEMKEESTDTKEGSYKGPVSEDGQLICAVCLDEVAIGQRKRVLPCAHAFHAKCVQIWLQKANRCPCCMKAVVRRVTLPDAPPRLPRLPERDIALERLIAMEIPHRRRFLGLWSFGPHRGVLPPEILRQMQQQAIAQQERNQRIIAEHARAAARNELPYSQEFTGQLERSRQMDNMPDVDINITA